MSDEQNVAPVGQPTGPAKKSSLLAQIFGALWITGWSTHLFAFSGQPYTVSDIVISGASIVAMFSPVFISIVLDKIKEIRVR